MTHPYLDNVTFSTILNKMFFYIFITYKLDIE